MKFNNKRLEKSSKLINYIIAIVLCGFLVATSSKIMYDVDSWEDSPQIEEFQNAELLNDLQLEIDSIYILQASKIEKQSNIQNTINIADSNYTNAKRSFDNWLAARKTVGSPNSDKEVITRAKELDNYYETKQEWQKELAIINDSILLYDNEVLVVQEIVNQDNSRAYEEQEVAIRKYDLKVFLMRLLFIFPILLIGIFFIFKFRKHKYWPLFLGFVLFSFYSFFFGLLPYLPSYGGYIRYAVGIILSVIFGIYFINKIKSFIEKKKNELKISGTERAKSVEIETAEKALDNHICPSCGKDFIIKQWDKSSSKKVKVEGFGIVTNFCRFCGLELFTKCTKCGSENFAHLPFCSTCGEKIADK